MAAVDTPEPKDDGKGKKRKKHRVGIRVDMTPMVDVAFLLLIFFMVTTVFKTPRAMEINLPEDKDAQVKLAESKVLTLRAVEGDKIYYNMGSETPKFVELKGLGAVLHEKASQFKVPGKQESDLNVVIKVDREARFHNLVDLLDNLAMNKITRFGFAPYTDDDKAKVASAGA